MLLGFWAAAQTNVAREVAERALAHVVRDRTEAAYQRDDLIAKRALLMEAWAKHCATVATGDNVVPLNRKAKR